MAGGIDVGKTLLAVFSFQKVDFVEVVLFACVHTRHLERPGCVVEDVAMDGKLFGDFHRSHILISA
jgi:hypothetical protein